MSKYPLKYRELLKRLKPLGIKELHVTRGKGSERILYRPTGPGSKKGEQYPAKHHGSNTEISHQVISAILRRFEIDPKKFW